jgi:hypothetical protein
MAGNSAQITIAQMARVYLAPVGTAAPADSTAVMATPWRDVGYFTPDSLQFATDPSFQEVKSHQSNYSTRRFQDADAASVQVDLQQWNGENFRAVFGGGTITPIVGTPTQYRFAPPSIGAREQVACIIEIIDGTKHYRRVIPACQQVEGVQQDMQKGQESILPLRLSVIGSDLGDPWYDLTDDPAFAPAA